MDARSLIQTTLLDLTRPGFQPAYQALQQYWLVRLGHRAGPGGPRRLFCRKLRQNPILCRLNYSVGILGRTRFGSRKRNVRINLDTGVPSDPPPPMCKAAAKLHPAAEHCDWR